MRDRKLHAAAALAFLAALWLGILLGVSFLATPVKFQAQSLSLPVALEVGQVTFSLFAKVEWVLALLTAGCLVAGRPGRSETMLALPVLAIVALQAFWLLPVLDVRLEAIIAGSAPPPSHHHIIYIVAEAAKALTLLALAWSAFRRAAGGGQNVSASMLKVVEQR